MSTVKPSTITRFLFLVLIVLLAVVGGTYQRTMASGDISKEDSGTFKVISYGSWDILIGGEGGSTRAYISYDHQSVEGIKAYVDANKKLVNDVFTNSSDSFPVEVTFSRPVEIEDFEKLIVSSRMDVARFEIRGLQADGRSVTVGGAPGAELVPRAKLLEFSQRASERGFPFAVEGVYFVVGKVNHDGYDMLAASDHVFMIDLTKIKAQEGVRTAFSIDIPADRFMVQSPYVFLEAHGLTTRDDTILK
jgi:hypothetical protein